MVDTEASHEEMEATINTRQEQTKPHVTQEKMEATINSIWSEMEETFKHQVDILILVNQYTQNLHEELNKIDET
jgi:hypothetical protein